MSPKTSVKSVKYLIMAFFLSIVNIAVRVEDKAGCLATSTITFCMHYCKEIADKTYWWKQLFSYAFLIT